MQERVYIAFIVKNIKEIHQEEDEIKRNASYAAANEFIKTLGMEHEDIVVDFLGQDGDLTLYSSGMIKISDIDAWQEKFVPKWKEMAFQVLGPDCQPYLEVEYPDESMEEYR